MSGRLGERWLAAAYRGAGWLSLLRPLEMLYCRVVERRAQGYANGRKAVWRAPIPVIVVGNITLGGTGKSPLVAWLAAWLVARGWQPGIVSRGYGGKSRHYPLHVSSQTPVAECGDEPLMLREQTGVALVVDPDRPRGVRALLEAGCDIVISDDGLQHLALGRDLEIAVVDGARGLGNARCLPAGPLREPAKRLRDVDAVLSNGPLAHPLPVTAHEMQLVPRRWRHVASGEHFPLMPLPFAPHVHGVAGIGHPARFFATLEGLGLEVMPHAFADHHRFSADDLRFDDQCPVVMTTKDAVKCRSIADAHCWALEVEAEPSAPFAAWLEERLAALVGSPTHCTDSKGETP